MTYVPGFSSKRGTLIAWGVGVRPLRIPLPLALGIRFLPCAEVLGDDYGGNEALHLPMLNQNHPITKERYE